ncbi:MAG: S9 family peptidase [Clostridium sp.]|nr:S9 family peptidase [Clostridium sp.]
MKISSAITLPMCAAMLLSSCGSEKTSDEKVIDRVEFKSQTGIFDIDALEALGRVSGTSISPDGTKVLYGIQYESLEENASNRDLYVKEIAGGDSVRITRTAKSEQNEAWIAGGEKIAFIYPDANGKPQIWVMNADGSGREKASDIEEGVAGFLLSPDEKKALIISSVKLERNADELYADLPKATGRVIDDLMYKHWDEWTTEVPHPFIADFDGKTISNAFDIMADEPMYEAPMKPFGGIESFAWSPDSKKLVYVSRKKTGVEYAISTNSDLYLYDLEANTTTNLTEGMMGYDTAPAFSPDGTKLAWLSMEHDGYESDQNRLFVLDMATGAKTNLTDAWDYTIDAFAWNPNGKSLWFVAPYHGVIPVFTIDMASHSIEMLTKDIMCDYSAIAPIDENTLLATHHSMLRPDELYIVDANGADKALTDVNGYIFAQLAMPTVEKHIVPTTNGEQMLVWAILPPNFNAEAKYPAILYCQGGPQQAVSQFWSYRWNLALMASNGYVMIAPNRHGVPGFGQDWLAQISKDYPGQNMKDYLTAVDYMKEKPYVDGDHIGATGASYGGFSVYWLAGNHDGRFKALLAHAGIFNMEAQYLETEEMWFANWDMGGSFWDKGNAAAERTFAMSPHRFVDKWDTPIMVSHGEFDYRILSSQGEMAFNAAKLRGIEAEMVIFPDENHWILKPQNAVLWQRLFFRWFDHLLKPQSAEAE